MGVVGVRCAGAGGSEGSSKVAVGVAVCVEELRCLLQFIVTFIVTL